MTIDWTKALSEPVETKPLPFENTAVVPFPDISTVKGGLAAYEQDLKDLIRSADMVVDSSESRDTAAEYIAQLAGLHKRMKAHMEERSKPVYDHYKEIRAPYLPYLEKLKDAETKLKNVRQAYITKQRLEEQKKQKELEEKRKRDQEELDAFAEKHGLEKAEIPTPVAEKQPTKTVTTYGTISERKNWTWELVDIAALSDEYKIPNETMLNRLVAAGVRKIIGLRIFQKTSEITRTR